MIDVVAKGGRTVALAVSTAVLAAGCLTAGPGACTSESRAAFHGIEQYGGIDLEPVDYPLGGRCAASFTSADPPAMVLDYYRAQWTAAGWTPDAETPVASPGEGEVDSVFFYATASKGGMTYSITAFNEDETRYELLVGPTDLDQE